MHNIVRFAIFGNSLQTIAQDALAVLWNELKGHKTHIAIDKDFFLACDNLPSNIMPDELIEGNDFEADLVFCIGGDGTFLEAARRVSNKQIPIMGVNTGRLGFLADFAPFDLKRVVQDVFEGKFVIENRSLIQVETYGGDIKGYPFALNEVAVLKHDMSSMIDIDVHVNGEHLTTYRADGLIVCTPTGSTGYALSVGGPVIVPQAGIFGITPVAPHSLNVRPITMNDDAVIELSVTSRSHNFMVAIDGRSESCNEGCKLVLRKAPYSVRVFQRKNHSFFATLRNKLMWGADSRS